MFSFQRFCTFVFTLWSFTSVLVNGLSVTGSRTLVLIDGKVDDVDNYSRFIDLLQSHSFDVTPLPLTSRSTKIHIFDETGDRLYDNIVIFPIKGRHFNKQLSAKKLIQFSESGGNILTVTNPIAASDSILAYLNQLGIYPSPKDYFLQDYFQEVGGDNDNSTNLQFQESCLLNPTIYKPQTETNDKPSSFSFGDQCSSALLDNREQLVPIMTASRTSFTRDADSNALWGAGTQSYLVAGFQNLYNARTAWVGSMAFFNDANFEQNSQFVDELVKWVFKEKAVVEMTGFRHTHADGRSYEEVPYKVTDEVVYEIGLKMWDGEKWVPYVADDVQFELRQVDPYYRITMHSSSSDNGNESMNYTTGPFKLPTRHGMFKFMTDYKRPGWTFVEVEDVRAIRHLANDEYRRSWEITNAWVYLASIYSVICLFVAFVFFFLTTPMSKAVPTEKKTN